MSEIEEVDNALVDWKGTAENLQREVTRLNAAHAEVLEQAEWTATAWQRYPDFKRRQVATAFPTVAHRLDVLLAVVRKHDPQPPAQPSDVIQVPS